MSNVYSCFYAIQKAVLKSGINRYKLYIWYKYEQILMSKSRIPKDAICTLFFYHYLLMHTLPQQRDCVKIIICCELSLSPKNKFWLSVMTNYNVSAGLSSWESITFRASLYVLRCRYIAYLFKNELHCTVYTTPHCVSGNMLRPSPVS